MSRTIPKTANAFPPNLLGAHRYTIYDGIVRPSGSLEDGIAPIKLGAKWEPTLPLRCKKRIYPFVQPQKRISILKCSYPELRFLRVPIRKVVRRCRSF